MTRRRRFRDPFGNLIEPPSTTKPVVIEQRGGVRYFEALRETQERERVAEEKKRANERVKIFSASTIIAERQQEKYAQERRWQLDMHDIILDRGVR